VLGAPRLRPTLTSTVSLSQVAACAALFSYGQFLPCVLWGAL